MISSRKSKEIAYPRQIAMYLCKKLTEKSLKYVGNYLGKRDHTTVLHGAKKIEAELQHNETLANTIDVIIKKINPN